MNDFSIANVPAGSKLILLGDWYRKIGKGWFVVCYFLDPNNNNVRVGLPVDMLPALIPGKTYPMTLKERKAKNHTGTFVLPAMTDWQRCKYVDLPNRLKRLGNFSEQIKNQSLFRLEHSGNTYWLPTAELARMLFFQSAEITRAAVYEGNTWQIARASTPDWQGKIDLSSNVPVSYLNNIQMRKFFAWLLLTESPQESFSSIFSSLNTQTVLTDKSERWTFTFSPPELGGVELSWVGYYETFGDNLEHRHCYIREIRSLAGLATPSVESVLFSHPDDELFIEGDERKDEDSKPPRPLPPKKKPKALDPNTPTEHKKRRRLLKITSTGFHFDSEIDLKRSPRPICGLPRGGEPEQEEQTDDSNVGVTEGERGGKNKRGDFNNLEDKENLNPPEKLVIFQEMLSELSIQYGWDTSSEIGDVPKMRCRSAHLIDGRARKYCFAKIIRDSTTVAYALEIELTNKESLSTLFFRARDIEQVLVMTLEDLMTNDASLNYKSMQWKRKLISENTVSRSYLEHPVQKVLSDIEALESWVNRAADRVFIL